MKNKKPTFIIGLTLAMNLCFAQQKVHIKGQFPTTDKDAKLYLFYKKGVEQPEHVDSLSFSDSRFQFDIMLKEPSLVTMVYNDCKEKTLSDLQATPEKVEAIGFMADTDTVELTFDGAFNKFDAAAASPIFNDFRRLNKLTTNNVRERMDSLNRIYPDPTDTAYQTASQKVMQQTSQELVDFLNQHLDSYMGLVTMDVIVARLPQLIPQLSNTLQNHYSQALRDTGLGRQLLASFQEYTKTKEQ